MEEDQKIKEHSIEKPNTKRPIGVWVISIWYCLSIVSAIIALFFVPNGTFDNFTPFELIVSVSATILNGVAAILLFNFKAKAFWMFLISFSVSLIPVFLRFLNDDLGAFYESLDQSTVILQLIIWAAMMFYIWSLKEKKILT